MAIQVGWYRKGHFFNEEYWIKHGIGKRPVDTLVNYMLLQQYWDFSVF